MVRNDGIYFCIQLFLSYNRMQAWHSSDIFIQNHIRCVNQNLNYCYKNHFLLLWMEMTPCNILLFHHSYTTRYKWCIDKSSIENDIQEALHSHLQLLCYYYLSKDFGELFSNILSVNQKCFLVISLVQIWNSL